VRKFAFTGNSQLADADLQADLKPWLDRPVGLADLRQAGNALESLFRDKGWLAKVTLPSQNVSDGTVRFDILVAKRGSIRITRQGATKPGTPPPGPAHRRPARRYHAAQRSFEPAAV
jgi:hemolysin activation/secretion protein